MTEAMVYRTQLFTASGVEGEFVLDEDSSGLVLLTLDIPESEARDIDVFADWWRSYAKLLRRRVREIVEEPAREAWGCSPLMRVLLPIPRAILTDSARPVYEEIEPKVRESVLTVLIRDRSRLLREREGAA